MTIQVVFASMFIEQKHGWSDILSGMPIVGIRESKKRVVEYVLGLETLKNEKERGRLSAVKAQIERDWKLIVSSMQDVALSGLAEIINLPQSPRVMKDKDLSRIVLTVDGGKTVPEAIGELPVEYDNLRQRKPRVIDNFDSLHVELSETEASILELEATTSSIVQQITSINATISALEADIEIINSDIRNNEDAARLQRFGSEATGSELSANICPTCKKSIHDSLLPNLENSTFMSIEDNIKHLKEQKKMLQFSLNGRRKSRDEMQLQKQQIEARLQTLRRLAQSLRSDMYSSLDTDVSEAIMLKKIEIARRIEQLNLHTDKIAVLLEKLSELSGQWNTYLDQKKKLPSKIFSDLDNEKNPFAKEEIY
jgi:chromosome segregation ATPase